MKKKILKGFTLVEMVVVLALFSLIMFSVAQLLDPVSKYFVRSANFENTTACVDNIRRAIEGNLKYANRVRAYSGFAAYDDSKPNEPSAQVLAHVRNFYTDFMTTKDIMDVSHKRAVTDTAGVIYVLVFDNNDHKNYQNIETLHEYNDGQKNRGMITLMEFKFDQYNGPNEPDIVASVNNADVQNWYVNPKLYGNFDFYYSLGEDTGSVPPPAESGEGESSAESSVPDANDISPSNFIINIFADEIVFNKELDAFEAVKSSNVSSATFSMKNVLDEHGKIGYDNVTYLSKGTDEAAAKPEDFSASRVLRFASESNPSASSDMFYFIYTTPDTTHSSGPYYEKAIKEEEGGIPGLDESST